jgi:hypothetical protein
VGDLNQKGIAGGVTETIVHYLESINIDAQDREYEIRMAPGNRESASNPVKQKSPVRKVRQTVVERIVR